MEPGLEERVSTLLNLQARQLLDKIVEVDDRLAGLGDGEEDRLEAIVLRALRRHLASELREIVGFADEGLVRLEPEVAARALAVVEA